MGGPGWTVRMGRVFGQQRRTVLIALDHLAVLPEPEPALGDPVTLVATVRDAGAHGVIITRGALAQTAGELAGLAVVLSIPLAGDPVPAAELALRLGADMVKVVFTPFTDSNDGGAAALSALTAVCQRWDLPVLVETVPGGFSATGADRHAPRLITAARMATELGATAIKTFAPRSTVNGSSGVDLAGLRELCRYAGVPVLLVGGDPIEPVELVRLWDLAIQAGAAGMAVGRNVWGAAEPGQVVALLVHAAGAVVSRTGHPDEWHRCAESAPADRGRDDRLHRGDPGHQTAEGVAGPGCGDTSGAV
jgi:DhnA family fructose-bisphosphate aldolase class Ia